MQIVFIRHSMTAGNLERRYIGCRTDERSVKQAFLWHSRKRRKFVRHFPCRKWF